MIRRPALALALLALLAGFPRFAAAGGVSSTSVSATETLTSVTTASTTFRPLFAARAKSLAKTIEPSRKPAVRAIWYSSPVATTAVTTSSPLRRKSAKKNP